MQPCSPATPYEYNPAIAFVGGGAGMAYNSGSAVALPPNLFAPSAVYAAGPVSIFPPGAPAAAGQRILVVNCTFTPNFYDELAITRGERVRVITIYDDGWCKVRKLGAGGEEGVVPHECLGGAPAAAEQSILVVKRTFTPNLCDELTITHGERVRVITIYDDGWCIVRKLGAGNEEGAVPLECLGDPGDCAQDGRVPRRTTS